MASLSASRLGDILLASASTADHTKKSKGLRSGEEGGYLSLAQKPSSPNLSQKVLGGVGSMGCGSILLEDHFPGPVHPVGGLQPGRNLDQDLFPVDISCDLQPLWHKERWHGLSITGYQAKDHDIQGVLAGRHRLNVDVPGRQEDPVVAVVVHLVNHKLLLICPEDNSRMP